MTTYVIDFETTYGSTNTLIKHSIEEYIRNPLFEVIGMGAVPLGHNCEAVWLTGNAIISWLDRANDSALVAHHAQFDGFILNQVYGINPAYWYDTLSMARAVYPRFDRHSLEFLADVLALGTPKSVPYNLFRDKTLAEINAVPGLQTQIGQGSLHDCQLTANLFRFLKPRVPQSELDLINHTVRLFTEPVLVGDREILQEALEAAIYERENLPAKLGLDMSVLLSDRKFATLLRGHGVEVPQKLSLRTGKTTYALAKGDVKFLALKEHSDESIRNLINARISAKTSIGETRAARLLSASSRGPIPVYLRYYGGHTGRFSGGDKLNLQNLPRGSKLRKAVKSPVGYTLVWGDLSQIECRILAWVAGANKLLTAFKDGRDVYSEFGTTAFNQKISKEHTPDLRYVAKKVVLGCGYGVGRDKFYNTLVTEGKKIDRQLSNKLVQTFREEYWQIPALWKAGDRVLEALYKSKNNEVQYIKYGNLTLELQGKKVMLPNGLYLDYEDIAQDDHGDFWSHGRKLWGGAFTENYIQALARIKITDSWLALEEENVHIVHQVHDELISCVKLIDCTDTAAIMEYILTEPVPWIPGLPLACEVEWGESYGK